MRIGVVSDTHIDDPRERLPAALLRGLAGVECILHAGDILIPEVIEQLAEIAPVQAVHGNNEDSAVRRLYPPERVLTFGSTVVGLFHGHGSYAAPMNALRRWHGRKVDVVVFGHSHLPLVEHAGGRLMVNPGSPTDPRRAPYPSFAILKIDEDEPGAAAEIVPLE